MRRGYRRHAPQPHDLLTHQRDDAVHLGQRKANFSLQRCLTCHAIAADGKRCRTPSRHFCRTATTTPPFRSTASSAIPRSGAAGGRRPRPRRPWDARDEPGRQAPARAPRPAPSWRRRRDASRPAWSSTTYAPAQRRPGEPASAQGALGHAGRPQQVPERLQRLRRRLHRGERPAGDDGPPPIRSGSARSSLKDCASGARAGCRSCASTAPNRPASTSARPAPRSSAPTASCWSTSTSASAAATA